MPSVGTKIKCVQNIENIKELFIYDLNGNFLCLALDESIAKLSKESFKMLKKGYESEVKAIKEVLKKDEIAAFTKLNIKQDLQDLQNAFENSLIEAKEVHQKSLAKETLKTQRELEYIKNNALNIIFPFVGILKFIWKPIYEVFKWVFDKCSGVFTSFKDIIMSVASPLAEFLNSIWQDIGDFFYNIFGSLFEWFASKLSWVGDMISSISGFIKDALDFVGLGDDEEIKISKNEQIKEKIISGNTYKDELQAKSINHTPSFNNGNINVSVNGTFNIATKDGNFNMQEFANAIQKSVFEALRKQEQNKINTTIYG